MKSLTTFLGLLALVLNVYGSPLDTWTAGTNRNDSVLSAAVGNGVIVAGTETATYLLSTNGYGWHPVTALNVAARGMVFDGRRFLSIGTRSLGISTNGIQWISRQIGDSSALNSITYGNGIYVIVGDSGAIWRSEDAVFWESVEPISSSSLVSVCYARGRFVAVGLSTVIESNDGRVWTDVSAASIYGWTAVGGNAERIVAVATSGRTLVHDKDGWHLVPSWTTRNLYSVVERNGVFFVGDNNGMVWQSRDSTNWVGFGSTSTALVKSLVFANRRMIAFTGHGPYISGEFSAQEGIATKLTLTPTLIFNSLAGVSYRIESASEIGGVWRLEATVTGIEEQTTWSAQHLPANELQRFFRVTETSD